MRVAPLGRPNAGRKVHADAPTQVIGHPEVAAWSMSFQDRAPTFFSARGAPVAVPLPADSAGLFAVAVHPKHGGLAGLVEPATSTDDEPQISVVDLRDPPKALLSLPGDRDSLQTWACSRSEGLLFLARPGELIAFEPMDDQSVRILYKVESPSLKLLSDASSRCTVATCCDAPVETLVLGRRPPSFQSRPEPLASVTIDYCGQSKGSERIYARLEAAGPAAPAELRRLAREFEAHGLTSELATLAKRSVAGEPPELVTAMNELLEDLRRRWSTYPDVAVFLAERSFRAGRWEEGTTLVELGLPNLDVSAARAHVLHVAAVGYLATGRFDAARDAIARMGDESPFCRGDRVLEWVEACEGSAPDRASAILVRAVRDCDEARRAGDARAALVAIDQPVAWNSGSRQVLARLAFAYLASPIQEGMAALRRDLALPEYLSVARSRSDTLFPVASLTLDAESLSALEQRARAVLSRGPHEEPTP